MIYTRFGVAVKIIKYFKKTGMVKLQSVKDSKWTSKRDVNALVADGGGKEIKEAIEMTINTREERLL